MSIFDFEVDQFSDYSNLVSPSFLRLLALIQSTIFVLIFFRSFVLQLDILYSHTLSSEYYRNVHRRRNKTYRYVSASHGHPHHNIIRYRSCDFCRIVDKLSRRSFHIFHGPNYYLLHSNRSKRACYCVYAIPGGIHAYIIHARTISLRAVNWKSHPKVPCVALHSARRSLLILRALDLHNNILAIGRIKQITKLYT